MIRNWKPLLPCLLLGYPCAAIGQGLEPLQFARTAHSQTRQYIHSIRATMKTTTWSKDEPANVITRSCKWIESGTSLRWELTTTSPNDRGSEQGKQPGLIMTQEVLINIQKDGKRTTIRTRREDGNTVGQQAEIVPSGQFIDADLWSGAGFIVMDSPRTPLLNVLETPDKSTSAAWASANNRKSLLVRHTMFDHNIEAYLAPEYGYLANRLVSTVLRQGKPSHVFLREIEGFKSYGPGLFFPSKAVSTYFAHNTGANDPLVKTSYDFEDVVINEDVDPATFTLEIPAGIRVVDTTKDVGYIMGSDGKPDPKHPVLKIVHADAATATAAKPPYSRDYSRTFVVAGSIFVLCVFVFYRYKRQHLQQTQSNQ